MSCENIFLILSHSLFAETFDQMLAHSAHLSQAQRDIMKLSMEDEITRLEGTRADILEELDAQTGWNLLPSTQRQQTMREYHFEKISYMFCFFRERYTTTFLKNPFCSIFAAQQQQQAQAQQHSPPQRGPTAGAATAATAFPSTSAAATAFPSTSAAGGTTSPSRRGRPHTRRRPRSRSRTQSRSPSRSRRAGSVVRSKPPAKMPKRGRRK